MKKIIFLVLLFLSQNSFSIEAYNCKEYSKVVMYIEYARDHDVLKNDFILKLNKIEDIKLRSIYLKNIELIYNFNKNTKYGKYLFNKCNFNNNILVFKEA